MYISRSLSLSVYRSLDNLFNSCVWDWFGNCGGCIWKFRYMMLCSALRSLIQSWLRDYDKIQSFAVILIYVQIGCALVGSLGALYNGVLLINLAIALFALVAIESSSQSLARTYAVLLFCAILLDIFWFILFTHEIWNISSEIYGTFAIFSVKLTFSVQIIGFFVRFLSSFLWVQMYRLGVSYVDSSAHREADFDMRNSFLSPSTPAIVRHSSGCDDALGGSIYDPVYYSSLFEDGQDNGYLYGVWLPPPACSIGLAAFCANVFLTIYGTESDHLNFVLYNYQGHNYGIGQGGSMSSAEASQLKPSLGRSSQVMNDEKAVNKFVSI